jgi:hypothetical protein
MDDDTEKAIDEALNGKPRSSELAQMIGALEMRRETFERELQTSDTDEQRKIWTQKMKETDRQIRLLREEMAITDFVERSVRSAATRPRAMLYEEDF